MIKTNLNIEKMDFITNEELCILYNKKNDYTISNIKCIDIANYDQYAKYILYYVPPLSKIILKNFKIKNNELKLLATIITSDIIINKSINKNF